MGQPDTPISVHSTAVPTVPAADKTATEQRLGRRAVAAGQLVAHVKRSVVRDFNLVCVTWTPDSARRGTTVEVRTRSAGRWSGWSVLDPDLDGPTPQPDGGSVTSYRDGTEPSWVGPATGVEVSVFAVQGKAPAALSVDTVDAGTSSYDKTVLTGKGRVAPSRDGKFPALPTVITRKEWGADESLGDDCWDPKYGSTFKAVVVHHTAGSNDYTQGEAAAVVRGVYAYHTEARGWCDIGYNFLIDRFGDIFEGRAGGIRKPVRGSHSGDYNVDTTGISLMGNFDLTSPPAAMRAALVNLAAWRLGTAYHGAYGRPYLYDGRFKRILGHRDVMSTSCPGQHVYDWLPTLRERVQTRLGDHETSIEEKWRSLGGRTSALGDVHVGEQVENGGHHTAFVNGRMYASPAGIHTLYAGHILARYLSTGETDGDFGYPRTNVHRIGDGLGYWAEFDGGRIYWSSPTGSHALHRSNVLKKYISVGGAVGALGFPLSPVLDTAKGARAKFEHGSIIYDASSHRTKVVRS
ncbi:MAG: N-acetylmuramoyl-L-alanine amidase [Nocardioidaceae bacterium]